MNITADERMAKSGMATVRMSLASANSQQYDPVGDITVQYDKDAHNDLSVAWENYLTALGMLKTDPHKYEWDINKPVEKLVIKEYKIRILGI